MPWKLVFVPPSDTQSQIGGGAWLENIENWPKIPGSENKMLPLLTLRQEDFFPDRECLLGMAITVFISSRTDTKGFSASVARKMCVSDNQSRDSVLRGGHSAVLLHRVGQKELTPDIETPYIKKNGVKLLPFSKTEETDDLEDEINGIECSKKAGRPSWIQDEIYMDPKHYFFLQITEEDITSISLRHEGVFRGGIGYLFLKNGLNKLGDNAIAGEFFIQFS